MELVNYMEEATKRSLDELLECAEYVDYKITEKQKLDILACALNQLPARYLVSEKGYLYTRADELKQQFKTDIIVELTKAILKVKANPR